MQSSHCVTYNVFHWWITLVDWQILVILVLVKPVFARPSIFFKLNLLKLLHWQNSWHIYVWIMQLSRNHNTQANTPQLNLDQTHSSNLNRPFAKLINPLSRSTSSFLSLLARELPLPRVLRLWVEVEFGECRPANMTHPSKSRL